MDLNKSFIEFFNKNKNVKLYGEVIDKYFNNSPKCRYCNNFIYYYDSTFKISHGELITKGKSFNNKKTLDKDYYLSICESCLIIKFPEYNKKNKARVFNQMNYITEYAFDIPSNVSKEWVKNKYVISECNLIKKWGFEIGAIKWLEYKKKQSMSNTFEYKNEKYGWDREKFDEFNKSRSVTIENLIKKHGEEEGLLIWDKYCEKQRYSTSLNYFIDKHGLDNGTLIYDNFCKKRLSGIGYSMVSKNLFDILSERFKEYSLFYAENEWFSYDCVNKKYYLIDFYIKELNIGIEFNGDIWHANPIKYSANDKPISFQNDYTAEYIWEKDKIKNEYLKTKLNKLIIIWESDFYKDGIDNTIDKILKIING